MKLTFIGADHEVTGSCHVLEIAGKRLTIDCGMEQGADIYENEDLALGDHIEIEQFEAVHTLNNQPLFCFSNYLQDQGITTSAQKFEKIEERSVSWKGRIWEWIHDHDSSGLYNLLF